MTSYRKAGPAGFPLIPGGIFSLIGSAKMIGGPAMAVVNLSNVVWPMLRVAIRLSLIVR